MGLLRRLSGPETTALSILNYNNNIILSSAMTSWFHFSYKITLSVLIIASPILFLTCFLMLENRRENARMGYRTIADEDPKSPNDSKNLPHSLQHLTFMEKLRKAFTISPKIIEIFLGIMSFDFVLSGVTTTLAFANSPFPPADHYKYYLMVSFTGLGVGRSYLGLVDYIKPGLSDKFILRHTWLLVVISVCHVVLLILASWYRFLPNVWIVLLLVFTLGIYCEVIYSNVAVILGEIEDPREREFCMGLTSFGVAVGALVSAFPVEKLLLNHCLTATNETVTCFTRAMTFERARNYSQLNLRVFT